MSLPAVLVRFFVATTVVATLGAGVGCSSSEDAAAPSDELSFELFDTTKRLSDADLAGLVSAPDGTLTFATAPASLADLAPGNVILAGLSAATPEGLLRYVTGVERDGAKLTIHTQQASLPLAFRRLHVKSQRDVTGFGSRPWTTNDLSPRTLRPTTELLGGNADAELPLDFQLYDADGDPTTTNDQVGIKGSLGGGFHYGISLDVDWGAVTKLPQAVSDCLLGAIKLQLDCTPAKLLPEVKLAFEADPYMKAHVSLYGAASLAYEKNWNLITIPLSPIPIGPLVFIPSVDITAKVQGSAGAGFSVGAHGLIELKSSVALSSKTGPDVTPIAIKNIDFAADDTKVILQAQAKVGVGARLNVQLYGVVGPYAQATAFAQVQADAFANPCWSLHVGVDTVLGVRVTSPTLPFIGSVTLLDWKGLELTPIDKVLTSGTCLPVEKGPPLPPGSGPDAVTYATPSFSPWAHVSSPVGDDGVVNSFLVDGLEWTNLAPTIDARYAAVGSRNESVVKFDDAGNLIWSRRYRPDTLTPFITLRRLVPTHDASMLILAKGGTAERMSLLKIGQNGGIWFRKHIELPADAKCDLEPFEIVRDAQSGFFVLGTCPDEQHAALVHVDENAEFLSVQLFGDVDPATRTIVPSAMTRFGDDVVVMGASSTTAEGTRMFAIRLSGVDASPKWSNRILGCPTAVDLHPAEARVNADNQLTIVGTAADHRAGMVMRIKDDGSLSFVNLNYLDAKGDLPYNMHSFAELPTTGILIAGSTHDTTQPTTQPTSLVVASLDSIGRTLWTKLYTLPNNRSLNQASLRITDDGGVVVSGIAQHTSMPGGSLFTMKAFAKDGDLKGAPGVTVTSMAALPPVACASQVVPWPVVVTPVSGVVVTSLPTLAEDAAVSTP